MSLFLRSLYLTGAALLSSGAAQAETFTLEQAVAKATKASPLLQAHEAAIAAARAGRRQAEIRPNPSLTLEAENFIGSGPYHIFGQAEITGTYSQPIERGGKRDARVAYAERGIGVAQASLRVTRLDIAAAVERAFIDIMLADAVIKITKYRLETEQGIEKEALRRVRNYKDPLFVETRAAARVAQAKIDMDQAQAKANAARNTLASFWSEKGNDLQVASEFLPFTPVELKLAKADISLADAETARAGAAVAVEQSRGVPDYTLSGGARFLRGTNDVALVAGITIPLGHFDRNQGNIARAQAEQLQAELTAEANRLAGLRRLASLRAEADAARSKAKAIMAEVYPRTIKTLAQVREGYNRGGFTFRDVQDAADAILAVQDQWLNAMIAYRNTQTEIDRLTGHFDDAAAVETQP